jgi:hypothetical protein
VCASQITEAPTRSPSLKRLIWQPSWLHNSRHGLGTVSDRNMVDEMVTNDDAYHTVELVFHLRGPGCRQKRLKQACATFLLIQERRVQIRRDH